MYVHGEPNVLSAKHKGNDPCWWTANPFRKFPRNVGFYLTARHLSNVQLELSSGCMYYLRPEHSVLTRKWTDTCTTWPGVFMHRDAEIKLYDA